MKPQKSVQATALPDDRLATTDERGRRLYLHPAEVVGFFRRRRSFFMGVLLFVFLVLPWIKIGGHQAILLDVARRRFAIFGLTFWAHDAPMLIFVLLSFVIGLLFVTSVWGRVWCGWACPQTVFIDMVYRKIEGWIEGDSRKRRKLMDAPWNAEKIARKGGKWLAFVAVSLVIAHSFLAYFVGVDELAVMVRQSPVDNPGAFGVMAFVAGLILFDFGWFREQFCIVACPYGRLQSVLMDDKSLAVVYDENRGEPRKRRGLDPSAQGDCVSCFRCVQVCPTGIDIRRGLQMECIACTACIDACDEVMDKIGKPSGLIRYASIQGLLDDYSVKDSPENEAPVGQAIDFSELKKVSGPAPKKKGVGWSTRSYLYLVMLLAVIGGLGFTVFNRQSLNVSIIRPPDAPYRMLNDNEVLNHFRLHLSNTGFNDESLQLTIEPEGYPIVAQANPVEVVGGGKKKTDIFIRFPVGDLQAGKRSVQLVVTPLSATGGKTQVRQRIELLGPIH